MSEGEGEAEVRLGGDNESMSKARQPKSAEYEQATPSRRLASAKRVRRSRLPPRRRSGAAAVSAEMSKANETKADERSISARNTKRD